MTAAKLTEAELLSLTEERQQAVREAIMLRQMPEYEPEDDAYSPLTDLGYTVVLWVAGALLICVSLAVVAGWL